MVTIVEIVKYMEIRADELKIDHSMTYDRVHEILEGIPSDEGKFEVIQIFCKLPELYEYKFDK